jgi:choline dehydrogenase
MSVPPAWLELLGSEVDWAYTTVPQKHTDNIEHFWPRGKVLGGSSSINAMAFGRGDRAPYDAWEATGATGWTYDKLLPYFMRERRGSRSGLPGMNGPLEVAPVQSRHPLSQALFDAVVAAGYPSTDDPSGAEPEGAGWYDTNIVRGVRQSAADAYLQPHLDRPKLTVVTDALVRKLTMEGTRCTGVEYEVDGEVRQARAVDEVVLTAGTIATGDHELPAHGDTLMVVISRP